MLNKENADEDHDDYSSYRNGGSVRMESREESNGVLYPIRRNPRIELRTFFWTCEHFIDYGFLVADWKDQS